MNPIAGIKNNDMFLIQTHLEDEGMNSNTLFDAKFDTLKNDYIIKDDNSVYEFINANDNLLILLEELKPLLHNHFSQNEFFLEVRCYPEIYKPELTLVIIINPYEDANKVTEKFLNINLAINECKNKLGLLGKFFIETERL